MKKKIVIGIIATLILTSAIGIVGMNFKSKKLTRENFHTDLLGENVYIFSPDDNPEEIQEVLDSAFLMAEIGQFEDDRYGFYFLPGEYHDIDVPVGFYTQVAGLGALPTDVKLPSVNCSARWLGTDDNHIALCNFWRSVENMQVTGDSMWAVSQATDMRRMQIDGDLYLHDEKGWASGGWLSNSNINGVVDSGSQQQWLSRNNKYSGWVGENWNEVFAGDDPAGVPTTSWPDHAYSAEDNVPIVREKPFLVYDEKEGFCIYVSSTKTDAVGADWLDQEPDHKLIPLSECYVAKDSIDNADTINQALAKGKDIVFTPGTYQLSDTLKVTREDTILLGLGLASLEPTEGLPCVSTEANGVTIAGLLFDAGQKESETLLVMEETEVENANPSLLSDVYFRVGGRRTDEPCKTKSCLVINQDNVIGDNLWIWRADHGDQVAWDKNTCANGIIINGDDATMYGLMVEHFQEYQTIWNGNNGRLVMYQSEVPYDVTDARAWSSHDGSVAGYSSITVADSVTDFYGMGIGIYLYNRDAKIPMETAMEVPDAPNVQVKNIITVMLNGNPGMHHCINQAGNSVTSIGQVAKVLYYCNGDWK
ncbi:MAG: sialidase [Pseudobutyrivibrio sp.]|nr:sialidase [Pseudobutyrivibrio sp.]